MSGISGVAGTASPQVAAVVNLARGTVGHRVILDRFSFVRVEEAA